jgi:adenylyltransferase/sulfurtransferase
VTPHLSLMIQLTLLSFGPLFPPGITICSEFLTFGLFISVPGIIGCLQALEAIKIAASVGEPLSGRMLLFDALSARIRIVC